jgi:hypothetical protein
VTYDHGSDVADEDDGDYAISDDSDDNDDRDAGVGMAGILFVCLY